MISLFHVLYSFILYVLAPVKLPKSSSPIPLYRQNAGFSEKSQTQNRLSLANAILTAENQSFMRKLWAKRVTLFEVV